MMNKLLSTILILTIAVISYGQNQQNIIVNLKAGQIDAFYADAPLSKRTNKPKVLSTDLDIISIPSSDELLKHIAGSSLVESYGFDSEVQLRKTPDDEYYRGQWALKLINAEKAWDVTTGGKFDGTHDIVIAVLDEGFDIDHEDLKDNIFINKNEIPDNGIDDDNNGYIDDYRGLNIETKNDQHHIDDHGTAVAGIIGAKTNNQKGISGVMWDVKMLPISRVSRQSEVIETFQYIVNMRRKWNETKGEEGVFVVATNYSAGIDDAFGTDEKYKSWCDMYDLLGSVGILNAGATTNRGTNVDEKGDMPTTCPSEYLIAVTNVGKEDVLVTAGYGAINIDLGAPGGTQEVPISSLDIKDKYGPFNGTSGATPHIAGAIGLLYSVPCQELVDLVYADPQKAAEQVRDAIINGAKSNQSLTGKTKTGARLDIFGAIEQLTKICSDPSETMSISNVTFDKDKITVMYNTKDLLAPIDFMISNNIGQVVYTSSSTPALGKGIITLDDVQLTRGMYYFSIYNKKEISTKSVLITE